MYNRVQWKVWPNILTFSKKKKLCSNQSRAADCTDNLINILSNSCKIISYKNLFNSSFLLLVQSYFSIELISIWIFMHFFLFHAVNLILLVAMLAKIINSLSVTLKLVMRSIRIDIIQNMKTMHCQWKSTLIIIIKLDASNSHWLYVYLYTTQFAFENSVSE